MSINSNSWRYVLQWYLYRKINKLCILGATAVSVYCTLKIGHHNRLICVLSTCVLSTGVEYVCVEYGHWVWALSMGVEYGHWVWVLSTGVEYGCVEYVCWVRALSMGIEYGCWVRALSAGAEYGCWVRVLSNYWVSWGVKEEQFVVCGCKHNF